MFYCEIDTIMINKIILNLFIINQGQSFLQLEQSELGLSIEETSKGNNIINLDNSIQSCSTNTMLIKDIKSSECRLFPFYNGIGGLLLKDELILFNKMKLLRKFPFNYDHNRDSIDSIVLSLNGQDCLCIFTDKNVLLVFGEFKPDRDNKVNKIVKRDIQDNKICFYDFIILEQQLYAFVSINGEYLSYTLIDLYKEEDTINKFNKTEFQCGKGVLIVINNKIHYMIENNLFKLN